MILRNKRALPPKASRVSPLNLANLRQNRGITLEEVADVTKISMRFLRAIEDEDFEQLPGGIFRTSYLRQYAVATGMEEERLLAHYDRVTNPQSIPENDSPQQERGLLDRWLRVPAQAPPH